MLWSALDCRKVEVVDVTDLIGSESNLLTAVRWDLYKVKGWRDASTVSCSPFQRGAELRADLLDRRECKPLAEKERNEVMPEDVSDLARTEGAVELLLQSRKMISKG
jgi:hypothetical protein